MSQSTMAVAATMIAQNDPSITSIIVEPSVCTTEEDACNLVDALAANTTLQSLEIYDVSMASQRHKLAEILTSGRNTTLQALELYNVTGLSDDFVSAMLGSSLKTLCVQGSNVIRFDCDALARNSTLQTLDLRDNIIGPDTARNLAAALSQNTTLQTLRLNHGFSTAIVANEFLSILGERHSSAIKTLGFGQNKYYADNLWSLAQFLTDNQHLETLDLSNSAIDFNIVARGLHTNSTLKSLDLTGTKLCISELAEVLVSTLSRIETLNISDNCLGNAEIHCLAKQLKYNTTLHTLILDDNNCGRSGALDLLKVATQSPFSALQTISLKSNKKGKIEEVQKKLERRVAKNLAARHAFLSGLHDPRSHNFELSHNFWALKNILSYVNVKTPKFII